MINNLSPKNIKALRIVFAGTALILLFLIIKSFLNISNYNSESKQLNGELLFSSMQWLSKQPDRVAAENALFRYYSCLEQGGIKIPDCLTLAKNASFTDRMLKTIEQSSVSYFLKKDFLNSSYISGYIQVRTPQSLWLDANSSIGK